MKKAILLLIFAILVISTPVLADVKIKTRQTMSGQVSENTTYIKGRRQRTEMFGGMNVSITQCDLERDLQLVPQTKTYTISFYGDDGDVSNNSAKPAADNGSRLPPSNTGGTLFITTTLKDTGERKQMFGFTARHIVQTIEIESSADACYPSKSKMEMDMWVIDAEFALTCSAGKEYAPKYNNNSGGCRDKVSSKTIGSAKSGYPVWQKITSTDPSGKESFSIINEVLEISKANLETSLFEVPADYREVSDASQMYAAGGTSGISFEGRSSSGSGMSYSTTKVEPSSGMSDSIRNALNPKSEERPALGEKKTGTLRIGLTAVNINAVGEGITAANLSLAIQNSLGEYLKGTKVEVVTLEAKLAAAQIDEAQSKSCDFIVLTSASHKKGGGGGFGFGKMLGQAVSQTGIGHTGSVASRPKYRQFRI